MFVILVLGLIKRGSNNTLLGNVHYLCFVLFNQAPAHDASYKGITDTEQKLSTKHFAGVKLVAAWKIPTHGVLANTSKGC